MAVSTETMQVFEPATEQVLAELPRAGAEEADEAVARAKEAFPAWRAVGPSDRGKLLRNLARVIDESLEELARLEARNVGKPISDTRDEVKMIINVFNYYTGAPEHLLNDTIPITNNVDM